MSNKIIFFGNERLATGVTTTTPTLKALIKAGYTVAAVVSHFSPGQSRNSRDLEIQAVALAHDIPVLLPDKLDDKVIEQLRSYGAEAAVLVAYGKLVPQAAIDIFPRGIINIHPSMLPKHRGPTPIESVILGGDSETGVSLMQLSKGMDAGPIFAQSSVELTGKESKQDLCDRLLEIGGTILIELLPEILSGTVVAMPQDESSATIDGMLSKESGKINWNKPAEQIEREIRAYAKWPRSYTTLGPLDIIVTKAALSNQKSEPGKVIIDDKRLFVGCANGSLELLAVQPAGKKEMTTQEFLAGYKSRIN